MNAREPIPGASPIDAAVPGPKVEGFHRTPWLDNQILQLEQLQPEQTTEFVLPEDIDYRYFIAELGRPSREYEFGGVYNPQTRSMKIIRGHAVGERGLLSPAGISFIRPRLNPDGRTTDDMFFHTHPWRENNIIRYFNIPENSCRPIGGDIDNVMATRMVEEEDRFERTVVSIIGSRGYISITEARGVRLDETVLKTAGISGLQLQKIKEYLACAPPVWVKNFARDDQSVQALVQLVESFYKARKTDRDTTYAQKVGVLVKNLAPHVREDGLNQLIEDLSGELPKYPEDGFLHNLGLTTSQVELVRQMSGVTIGLYQVIEGVGLHKVE